MKTKTLIRLSHAFLMILALVSNVDAATCPATGSYTKSCGAVACDSTTNILVGTCDVGASRYITTSLDMTKCPTSNVRNDNGHLKCS